MRLKKILITASIVALVSSPLIALTFINLFPKQNATNNRYLIEDEISKKANNGKLKTALDNTIGDDQLNFKFYTLTRTNQYTPSMLSWFVELDKALGALDSRLGFELIPRTNQTVETGFRNKNGEMISMFWAPDYHNIGTWLGLHFYPNYQVPNLWPSLYEFLNSGISTGALPADDVKFGPLNSVFQPSQWAKSLIDFLKNPINNYVPHISLPGTVNKSLYQEYDKLLELDKIVVKARPSVSKTGARESVANAIGIWADMNNQLAIGLINWMDQQNLALPWIANGPSTTLNTLVRNGYHTPTNDYSGKTFRDWYYDSTKVDGKNLTWWNPTDPFAVNRTPYNASFNDSTNNMFFQSTYNGLLDWKIVDDWKYDVDPVTNVGQWTPPKHSFIMSGASKIEFFKSETEMAPLFQLDRNVSLPGSAQPYHLEINTNHPQYIEALTNSTKISFEVDASDNNFFPWLSHDGKEQGRVRARDYFWGLMGYYLSTRLGINTNGYYLNLMNIDIHETIKANNIFYNGVYDSELGLASITPKNINDASSLFNKFTIILTKPNINVLDIFSKQFFQPLPIKNPKVQKIFEIPGNEALFDKEGNFLINNINFNTLYGSGEIKNNFTDWWAAGPYYVNRVSEQDIQFRINPKYFEILEKGGKKPFGNNPKIENIIMKYAGAFSPQVTFEQFKTGEIDMSEIPAALIGDANKELGDHFRSEGVSIVARTDLIPYNINVYEFDDSEENAGFLVHKKDKDGNKILKSLVSKQYEKAIVKDFHLGEKGNSWIIRNAIAQSIDWYSLSALAYPNNNPSYQQSIVPFGNIRALSGNLTSYPDFRNKPTYYETSANNSQIGFLRRTLDQYKKNWETQWKPKG